MLGSRALSLARYSVQFGAVREVFGDVLLHVGGLRRILKQLRDLVQLE